MWYDIMAYHMSYHTTHPNRSYHMSYYTLHRITPYIISYRAICHIIYHIPYHTIWYHIISHHMSYHMISYHARHHHLSSFVLLPSPCAVSKTIEAATRLLRGFCDAALNRVTTVWLSSRHILSKRRRVPSHWVIMPCHWGHYNRAIRTLCI